MWFLKMANEILLARMWNTFIPIFGFRNKWFWIYYLYFSSSMPISCGISFSVNLSLARDAGRQGGLDKEDTDADEDEDKDTAQLPHHVTWMRKHKDSHMRRGRTWLGFRPGLSWIFEQDPKTDGDEDEWAATRTQFAVVVSLTESSLAVSCPEDQEPNSWLYTGTHTSRKSCRISVSTYRK